MVESLTVYYKKREYEEDKWRTPISKNKPTVNELIYIYESPHQARIPDLRTKDKDDHRDVCRVYQLIKITPSFTHAIHEIQNTCT